MSNDYKYVLQYLDNGVVSTVEFPGELTTDDLQEYLSRFLATAGWSESQIKDILRIDDAEYYINSLKEDINDEY